MDEGCAVHIARRWTGARDAHVHPRGTDVCGRWQLPASDSGGDRICSISRILGYDVYNTRINYINTNIDVYIASVRCIGVFRPAWRCHRHRRISRGSSAHCCLLQLMQFISVSDFSLWKNTEERGVEDSRSAKTTGVYRVFFSVTLGTREAYDSARAN